MVFYLLNIYSDDYQSALKYLKDIKANLSNVIIITGDFNIRDSNWNLLYLYYSTHADTLSEVANAVNLKWSSPINPVSTKYVNNLNNYNFIIDLMFFKGNSRELNSHLIIPDLRGLSNYVPLIISIII